MTKPKAVPFAEVTDPSGGVTHLYVRVGDCEFQPPFNLPAIALAAELNRAVAAREANLVAALRLAKNHVNHSYHCGNTVGVPRCDCGADDAIKAASAALKGTGPDVVAELRAQVEALRADKGPWMVLADLANSGGLASERAAQLLRALNGDRLALASNHDVLVEVNRRGLGKAIVSAGMRGAAAAMAPMDAETARRIRRTADSLDPAFCAHCNNLPYSGTTLACPTCGIDRHGVGHGAG